jgi:diketogulonate reductase-like aldo/keto reductase
MDQHNYLISTYGVRLPKIIYGTAWKKGLTAGFVEQALGLGFRGIDTACQPKHYHEAGVGEGIAACLGAKLDRTELYLQSKFTSLNGHDPQRIPYDPNASLGDQVAQSFQVSLKNLQTTYLDCLVLHSPLSSLQKTMEVWRAMERIFHTGAVKQLGISNCYNLQTLEDLHEAAEIKPAVVQNRFYADTQYDRNIRFFCKQQGIIYQSFWTLSANPQVLTNPVILKLAASYNRTAAQVFFRYLIQVGIVPLTGTTSAQHMRDDLAIFGFALSPDDIAAVEALL